MNPEIRDIENVKNLKRFCIPMCDRNYLFSIDLTLGQKLKTYRQNNCFIEMFELVAHFHEESNFLLFREQVEILNSINPIHSLQLWLKDFKRILDLERILLFLNDFRNLKCLQFIMLNLKTKFNFKICKQISEKFLFLENLKIISASISKEMVNLFACNLPKLKMLILDEIESFDENDVAAWNKGRNKLNGPTDLTIYSNRYIFWMREVYFGRGLLPKV